VRLFDPSGGAIAPGGTVATEDVSPRKTRRARSSENQLSESYVIFMVRENSPSSAATEDNGSGYLVHGLLAKTSAPR
jgi:hypothetical protein